MPRSAIPGILRTCFLEEDFMMLSAAKEKRQHGSMQVPYSYYDCRMPDYFPGVPLHWHGEMELNYIKRGTGYFQYEMYNLIANLNVKENIEVGAYLSDNALDIDELLHTLGLYEHRYKLPNQLSGGQQQRVSIGRAIVKNPDILLCDEPTGALDYNTSKEILKLIEDVNKKYGNTIIMVTHNEAIKNMADHVIKLRDGAVRHNERNEHKISAADLEW